MIDTRPAPSNAFVEGHWLPIKDGDPRGMALFRRHYSFHYYRDNRPRRLFVGPGEKMVLMTLECNALFVWRKFIDKSGQQGVNCAVFRNESQLQSSMLIMEAEGLAWMRWPKARLYTYVNAAAVQSANPGYCFKCAGWEVCGRTQSGLLILDKYHD